jgi:dihydrofolate reductase
MSRVRVNCFAVSVDGFGAGPEQSLDNPLGVGGTGLHNWFYDTATFQAMFGKSGQTEGPDNELAAAGMENIGAWILGRNMFAPSRGPWPDDGWRGWWGESPPYHTPVFVLTNHRRDPLEMDGGTTFYFETGGIDAALEKAREAAGERDVRIGGGPNVIRQYLKAGLVDQLHLVVSPILLGSGEPLLEGIDLTALGFVVDRHVATPHAMHVIMEKA